MNRDLELPSIHDRQTTLTSESSLEEMALSGYGVLRRRYRLVGLFAAIGFSCGLLYLLFTPRVYTAQGELLFDRGNQPVVVQQPVLTDAPFDSSFFESQLKFLASDQVLLDVVRKLNLTNDPEFGSRGMLGAIIGLFRPSSPDTQLDQELQAAQNLHSKLDAKRVGATYFVEVSVQAHDPALAERIVNALVESFIASQREARRTAARQANQWLEQRLDELRHKADESEQAVNAYKAANNIVKPGGTSIGDQALSALNAELISVRARVSETAARLDRINAIIRNGNSDLTPEATVSDVVNSPIVVPLRQTYVNLANKEAEYTARYGKDHLAVVAIRQKLRIIQNSILGELRRAGETTKSEYEIAKKRQEILQQELASSVTKSEETDRAQVALRDLESAAQSSRALYNLFQQKLLESAQQQSSLFSEIQLTKPASATNQKRTLKVIGATLGGGLGIGLALALMLEVMNRSFRASKDVETILGAPCLSVVPMEKEGSATTGFQHAPMPQQLDHCCAHSPLLDRIVRDHTSPATEAVRAIKLAVDLHFNSPNKAEPRRAGVVIGVTSALPNEGKSTIATAFALVASQAGRRAIIVDCDFRNPSTSRALAPDAASGLLDVLRNTCSLNDALRIDLAPNLAVLPAGDNSRPVDAYELFSVPAAAQLFARLRQSYDYIILDLSPILPVSDTHAGSHLVDLFLFVVEWGGTKVNLVERALNSSNLIADKLLGVVLNKADTKFIDTYDSYDYKKYYGPPATSTEPKQLIEAFLRRKM